MGRVERGRYNGSSTRFDETVGADDFIPPTREQHWRNLYHREPPAMKRSSRNGRLCKTRAKIK